jgi:purine-nucleoside phosphorylase
VCSSDLPVGHLLAASGAVAVSLDVLSGRAYRPEIEVTRWAATLALPFPAALVAVPPAITVDPEGAALLGAVAPAEHLELTGVFAAAHGAGVPVGALLGVANRVGPDAHAEWKAHHAAVSRALVAALAPLLPGLLR